MRLQRVGRKHETAFRVVLTDSKNSTKSGKFKEILGSYDPRKSTDLLKNDRIKFWLDKGVRVTGSINNLFVNHKIISGKKVNVLPKKTYTAPVVEAPKEEVKASSAEATASQAEASVVEESPAEVAPEAPVVEETPVVEEAPVVETAPETPVEAPAEEVVQ